MLGCGHHRCKEPCHSGPHPECEVVREKRCYCGQETKEETCSERDERYSCAGSEGGSWTGEYSCARPCPWCAFPSVLEELCGPQLHRKYSCGVHSCSSTCHPHSSTEALLCPRDPSLVTRCPCGATALVSPRQACTDPIPTCGRLCGKTLDCGHACQALCHESDAHPPCTEPITVVCRCGHDKTSLSCTEATRTKAREGEKLCDRPCRAMRHCGRHVCHRICCSLAYQEASVASSKGRKGKRAAQITAAELELDDPLGIHVCDLTCGRPLACGRHQCDRPDHRGPCPPCYNASFEELVCDCGRTIIEPPIPCGTKLHCRFPCTRPPPDCGHPKSEHTCHSDEEGCPPCPFLTTKTCGCPREMAVRNVKCSADRVSCGSPCGRLLSCGWHKCRKVRSLVCCLNGVIVMPSTAMSSCRRVRGVHTDLLEAQTVVVRSKTSLRRERALDGCTALIPARYPVMHLPLAHSTRPARPSSKRPASAVRSSKRSPAAQRPLDPKAMPLDSSSAMTLVLSPNAMPLSPMPSVLTSLLEPLRTLSNGLSSLCRLTKRIRNGRRVSKKR